MLYRIRMQIESGVEFLLDKYIEDAEREKLQQFYREIIQSQEKNGGNNPVVEFSVQDIHRVDRHYFATATRASSSQVIVCCKDNTDKINQAANAERMQSMQQMCDHIDTIVSRHAIGMMSFRYDNGLFYPIYVSRSAAISWISSGKKCGKPKGGHPHRKSACPQRRFV